MRNYEGIWTVTVHIWNGYFFHSAYLPRVNQYSCNANCRFVIIFWKATAGICLVILKSTNTYFHINKEHLHFNLGVKIPG